MGLKETSECFQGDLDKEDMAAPYSGHFYFFQCVLLSVCGDGALRDKQSAVNLSARERLVMQKEDGCN